MSTPRTLALLSIALATLALLHGCGNAGAAGRGRGKEIAPNETVEVTLDSRNTTFAEFYVDVPRDAVSLRWKLLAQHVELDLACRMSDPVDAKDDVWDFRVSSDIGEAMVVYDRFSKPRIGKERFYARVEYPSDEPPRTPDGARLPLHFTLEAAVTRARVDGQLAPGAVQTGSIELSNGDFRTYTIDVPPNTPVLRLDLVEASSDLDILARFGRPVLAIDDDVRVAEHAFGRETLVVRNADGAPLEPGVWYVDVVDRWRDDRRSSFVLHARFDAAPPREVLEYPVIPPAIGEGPLSRALAAVVELVIDDATGGGVIVAPDGWILTCAHVVSEVGETNAKDVVVALTLDPKTSARELFRAEVREIDRTRDLALLRLKSGFYGQELPRDLVLPSLPVAFDAAPKIGDTLFLVGYPSTGGQGQRVSISVTRGIVAGFETVDFGVVIKTDAEITNGNSGGAAVDAEGRLIGIAASTIENGAGQTGFVHPVGLVPEGWRKNFAAGK